MKKLSEIDLQEMLFLKEDNTAKKNKKTTAKEDGEAQAEELCVEESPQEKTQEHPQEDIFIDVMKNVKPLKNAHKFSTFEYKQLNLKNVSFNKDAKNNNNENFKINSLTKKDIKNIKNHKKYIEATLDLHGETSKNAEILLNNFAQKSYLQGKRLVIVITGKGKHSSEKQDGIGVLKSMFLNWLKTEVARKYVVSFSITNPEHGGEGSYYLALRKNPNL